MSKASQVVVLAEDRRQQNFVRRYLLRANYLKHQIILEPLPGDRGSGEQWVRSRYSKNVEAYRARAGRAETALVVIIDADTGEVEDRVRHLGEALAAADQGDRMANEKVVQLIPKRNIETWIVCLNGFDANETTDFKLRENIPAGIRDVESYIQPAALRLFEWSRLNAQQAQNCIPSLKRAIVEVRRLD
jgi:hypothetical protein